MLFHFSCLKFQRQAPRIVVHKGDEPLLEGFERIAATGGTIQPAPNYRHRGPVVYPPRNTPATLCHVETDADYVMLFEPDMIFLQPLALEDLAVGPRQATFDPVTYLDPDCAAYQPAVDEVCRRSGIEPRALRDRPINGGVPHLVPRSLVREFGAHWLQGIELFAQYALECADGNAELAAEKIDWIASMWAVVLAVHRLGLTPVMTRLCLLNVEGRSPLPPADPSGPKIIHYCYGGEDFTKRAFISLPAAMYDVWRVSPDDGSINGAIRGQLHAAREFYGL
jgi:hypothetical protein